MSWHPHAKKSQSDFVLEIFIISMPEPEYLEPPNFAEVHVARTFVFCVLFCESLFGLLSVFFWPLHCLSFYYLRFWWPLWYLQAFFLRRFSVWIAQNKITVPRILFIWYMLCDIDLYITSRFSYIIKGMKW